MKDIIVDSSAATLSDDATPERTLQSIMEAPEHLDTHHPYRRATNLNKTSVTCHQSRSGVDVEVGEGVFQATFQGKSPCSTNVTLPQNVNISRNGDALDHHTASSYPLNVYYQNVGGMNTTAHEYLLSTSDCSYDVIALSETWLNENTISSQVIGPDYTVFRKDRNIKNSRKRNGGGVLVAVKKGLKARLVEDDSWDSVEQVCVVIDMTDRKLFLCVVYLPLDRT